MAKPDDRITEPNEDPGTLSALDSDDAPAYYGLESALPDTQRQVEAASSRTEQPVEIEVIHPKELVQELWPEESSDS